MCDTSRGGLRLPPGRSRSGGGHGSQGGDHDRAPVGGAPRTTTNRGVRGGGVPAPGDLPAELLPVQTALPGRGPRGPEGPFQAALRLTVADPCRPRGGDLRHAQGPSPVGGPADQGRAPPLRGRPSGRLHHPPSAPAQPPGGRPAEETPQGPETLRAGGPQRSVADRRHQDPPR